MRVLVSGSSGLIGTALRHALARDGHDVVRLVRRAPTGADQRFWDPDQGQLETSAVEGFDAVVHLAGAGIGDARWSTSRKQLLVDSRVDSTGLLVSRLAAAQDKPQVLISASAIGYYGERDEPVTEVDGPADPPDFLSQLCVAWENAAAPAHDAGIRTVYLRTGLVVSPDGGALGKLLLPFKLGVGGRLGSGKTWWSWISVQDHVRATLHLIHQPVSGPVNLTAPSPVRSEEFTKTLGRVLKRPTVIPAPRFALEILLGKELAEALLFTSARILPAKLEDSGFEFTHPDLEAALREIL